MFIIKMIILAIGKEKYLLQHLKQNWTDLYKFGLHTLGFDS